jgi:hypothetical protein
MWLESLHYPDVEVALAADRAQQLCALWQHPDIVTLCTVWPRLVYRLWPYYLLLASLAKMPASQASVPVSLRAICTDTAAVTRLRALFSSRLSWGLLGALERLRAAWLPAIAATATATATGPTVAHAGAALATTWSLPGAETVFVYEPSRTNVEGVWTEEGGNTAAAIAGAGTHCLHSISFDTVLCQVCTTPSLGLLYLFSVAL